MNSNEKGTWGYNQMLGSINPGMSFLRGFISTLQVYFGARSDVLGREEQSWITTCSIKIARLVSIQILEETKRDRAQPASSGLYSAQ